MASQTEHQVPSGIGEALRARITELNLRQVDAAERIGVGKQAVHDWLAGRRTPRAEYVPALAKFLAIPQRDVRQLLQQSHGADRLARLEQLVTELGAEIVSLRQELQALRSNGHAAP